MVKLKHKNGKFWYSLFSNPLPRVMKSENFIAYLQELPPGECVLDYGSGDRPYEALLLTKFKEYVAADYATTNEKHSGKADIYIEDDRIDVPENSIDCIVFTEVMEHLYTPKDVLANLYRALKPGGHLVGTVPFSVSQHEQPYDFHRYTYFCLERMFEDSGFRIRRLDYVGDMIAVSISVTSRVLMILPKALAKAKLGFLATPLTWLIRVPEFIYYYLRKLGLNPEKVTYFQQFPLGFTFLLEKPATP